MQPPRQHSRINLSELKAQMEKKLGPDRSKQYFYNLNRFLSLKLNKVEFNNICLKILGRENIPLHNQLIRSMLKNACTSKTPPATPKPGIQISSKDTTISSKNHHINGSHANMAEPFGSPGFTNGGDMLLPISPKKARTGLRDRKGGDRRSTLGRNGKTTFAPQPPSNFNDVTLNGDLITQHRHINGFMQKTENGENKILGTEGSNTSVLRRCTSVSAQHERSLEDRIELSLPASPIQAPLGVPFCPVSTGGARWDSVGSGGHMGSLSCDGILADSLTLKEHMERIALAECLEGASLDSANVLNHGLDSYMKRLIRSCIERVGSTQWRDVPTSSSSSSNSMSYRHGYLKPINGVRPGCKNLVQNSGKPLEVQEPRNYRPISLRDLRVAVEMNPCNLDEDWPLLLEKICINAFGE